MYIELFIDERVDRLIDLIDDVSCLNGLIDLGPLGLYEEIYNARVPRLREYRLSNTPP